jgi:hypothetical protein
LENGGTVVFAKSLIPEEWNGRTRFSLLRRIKRLYGIIETSQSKGKGIYSSEEEITVDKEIQLYQKVRLLYFLLIYVDT